ncbi:MAG: gfo/Idh/MocA family oxidoreductase [Proteobacteria bacterium]|jgi:predicted dehydrogenase|nr:gfo/Idh/MocA family oxidoreductase [Pseudomonadota bacterium]
MDLDLRIGSVERCRPTTESLPMPTPLRLGIIGTGFIADVIAQALRGTREVELAAVASRRVETATAFAAKHGSVPVFESGQSLIASGTVDAVYVATPTAAREPFCLAAAARGLSVLADKPFLNRDSLLKITDACTRAGVAFLDGTHFTHHPRTRAVREALPEKTGPLQGLRTSFFFPALDRNNIRLRPDQEPTGAIGDMAWYSMRAIVEYSGSEAPVAECRSWAQRDPVTGGWIRGTGFMRLSDGFTATWDAGYTVGACLMDLDLMGSRGVISIDDFVLDWDGGFGAPDTTRPVGFTHRFGMANPASWVRTETPSPLRQSTRMLEAFAQLTRDPRGPAVTASIQRSLRTQELVDALVASLRD